MKKILPAVVITVAVFATSCRKERTCECKTTQTTVRTGFDAHTETESSSYKITMAKQRKRDFKLMSDCVSTRDTHTEYGGSGNSAHTDVITTETTCDLK